MKIFQSFITVAAGLAMVSCSSLDTPAEATPAASEPTPTAAKKSGADATPRQASATAATATGTAAESIAPTPEQQAAAQQILADDAAPAAQSLDTLPEPVATMEIFDEEAEASTPASIPGRNALRMRRYAPPEEAVSAGDAQPLRPNRAEQHGFRSPILPTKLPMDIHGKLTGEGNN